jgi:hypothetical protein
MHHATCKLAVPNRRDWSLERRPLTPPKYLDSASNLPTSLHRTIPSPDTKSNKQYTTKMAAPETVNIKNLQGKWVMVSLT